MQKKLNECAERGDEAGIRLLAARLDAQLKLEDFRIKFRESEHPKLKVWGTMAMSGVVAFITALLTRLLR
jgi:hypothetical protein